MRYALLLLRLPSHHQSHHSYHHCILLRYSYQAARSERPPAGASHSRFATAVSTSATATSPAASSGPKARVSWSESAVPDKRERAKQRGWAAEGGAGLRTRVSWSERAVAVSVGCSQSRSVSGSLVRRVCRQTRVPPPRGRTRGAACER